MNTVKVVVANGGSHPLHELTLITDGLYGAEFLLKRPIPAFLVAVLPRGGFVTGRDGNFEIGTHVQMFLAQVFATPVKVQILGWIVVAERVVQSAQDEVGIMVEAEALTHQLAGE